MKIAFILPLFRVKSSKFDGPPLSTPIVVGGLRHYFQDIDITQIDLNNEADFLVKNKLMRAEDFSKVLSDTKNILLFNGSENKKIINNRVEQGFYIPDDEDLLSFLGFFEDLYQKLSLEEFDCFLLSVYQIYEENILSMLLFARFLKIKNKKVVIGGMRNSTNFFTELKENGGLNFIDSIIVGNGIESSKGLINDLQKNNDLKKVYLPGSGFKNNLYFPDYATFRHLENFRTSFIEIKKDYNIDIDKRTEEDILFIPYKFSTGCFWGKCIYCGQSSHAGSFHFKKIPEIVADIKKLKELCRTRHFIFYNNNFNFNLDFSKKLLQEMIDQKLDILWTDSFNLRVLDDELLELLVGAGCIRMDIGLVSLNNEIQKYYNNIIQNDKYLNNLVKADRAGIWVDISLIANLPHNFNIDNEVKKLKEFIHHIDAVTLNSYRAYKSEIVNNHNKYNLRIVNKRVTIEDFSMPMYFIENDFKGTIDDRIKIFIEHFLKLKKIFLENKIVFNNKMFYPLAYLYTIYGHQNKKEIKRIMDQILRSFFEKEALKFEKYNKNNLLLY